jgi:hypothetical protein
MSSILIISKVEQLQERIISTIHDLKGDPGVYVSLNKPWNATETMLGGQQNTLFFIDCVSDEHLTREVVHIKPDDLETLKIAIKEYLRLLKGKKFLFFDSLATLMIYNNENKVAQFIQEITATLNDEEQLKIIACSPKTESELLLNKIFNFFDSVEEIE